jgi:16S rRNA (uracil1498-N3)-methyltransferase
MREPRRPDTAFWVERSSVLGDRLTLDPSESRHLLQVFRATPGTPFEAVDGEGEAYDCVLESVSNGLATARVIGRERDRGELPASVRLVVGLPELGAAETIVQHAVPLGATAIDFPPCARSGRGPLGEERLERLRRLAKAATKQSRRTRLCPIGSPESLEAAVSSLGSGAKYVADPIVRAARNDGISPMQPHVALVIGPPGGFLDRELELLRGLGFQAISLGPSRLRTETAAIGLLAVVRNYLI